MHDNLLYTVPEAAELLKRWVNDTYQKLKMLSQKKESEAKKDVRKNI